MIQYPTVMLSLNVTRQMSLKGAEHRVLYAITRRLDLDKSRKRVSKKNKIEMTRRYISQQLFHLSMLTVKWK